MSYGSRRPTQRRDKPRSYPSDFAVWSLIVILCALILGSLVWGLTHELPTESERRPQNLIKHDSLCATYTYDGEVVRWYVFVDPDYGTQWVYNDHDWRAFPRIGADGTQIGVQSQSDYD